MRTAAKQTGTDKDACNDAPVDVRPRIHKDTGDRVQFFAELLHETLTSEMTGIKKAAERNGQL